MTTIPYNLQLLLLLNQFIVAYLDHTAASSAVHAQLKSRSFLHPKFNSTECPSVWYEFNQTTWDCQCIPLKGLTCDGEHAYTYTHYFLTYDSANKRVCSQSGEYRGYVILKGHNVTKLEDGYLYCCQITFLNSIDTCVDL